MEDRFNRVEIHLERLERRVDEINTSVARLEGRTETTTELIHRIIWSLMGLVAVLVGKETWAAFDRGGTPMIEHVNFLLTVFFYGGYSMNLFLRAFIRPEPSIRVAAGAALVLLAGFIRMEIGFRDVTDQSALSYAVPLFMASCLLFTESLLLWKDYSIRMIVRGWHFLLRASS